MSSADGQRKVVINNVYGRGFNMSQEAVELYAKYAGLEITVAPDPWNCPTYYITTARGVQLWRPCWLDSRDDPNLIRAVSELGKQANADGSQLTIIEIPADIEWRIVAEDGLEHVEEKHRCWYGPLTT